jgi:hypothetical protein
MKLAIMQPYFCPYIGYFQLIKSVDKFVLYDNIEYTKKGWISRNRMLLNGSDEYFSIPLKKDSDFLNINQRFLSETANKELNKIVRRIKENYKKAPYFNNVFYLVEQTFLFDEKNLFKYIFNSIQNLCNYLEIRTEIIISSQLNIEDKLRAEERVISICKHLGAKDYINPIGGLSLYDKNVFMQNEMTLYFLQSDLFKYKQFSDKFIPWLSIIDIMMFNSKAEIQKMLTRYKLI